MGHKQDEVKAGEGWAILLIIVLTLFACLSVAIETFNLHTS